LNNFNDELNLIYDKLMAWFVCTVFLAMALMVIYIFITKIFKSEL